MDELKLICKGVLYHGKFEAEVFSITVTRHNYELVEAKLLNERKRIVSFLSKLKDDGEIKSISRPRNKQLQEGLQNLIQAKKEIKKSLEKIKPIFSD